MGIFDALNTAVGGLQAQSFALQNISGNIANASTVGYKGIATAFEDLIPDSLTPNKQVAGGVTALAQQTITTQGTVSGSTVATNIAINGDGFFSVQQPTGITDNVPTFSGVTDYTRRGDFQVNANGNLVNGAGYYLLGVPVDPKTGNPLGNVPSVLQFQNNFIPAQATTAIQYAANLPTVPVTAVSASAAPKTITAAGGLNQADFIGANPVVLNSAPPPFGNSFVTGNQVQSGGSPITSATLLSALSGSIASDTVTVDGTVINFTNAAPAQGLPGTLTGSVDLATAGISDAAALNFTVEGKPVSLTAGTGHGAGNTFSPADIAAAINGAGTDVTASVNAGNEIVLTQNTPSTTPISVTGAAAVFGNTPAPTIVAGVSGGAAGTLTGSVDIATAGIPDASALNFTVDGKAVSLAAGSGHGAGNTFSPADIAAAINGAGTDVTATVNAGNEIVLTQTTPTTGSIAVTGTGAATVFGGSPAIVTGTAPAATFAITAAIPGPPPVPRTLSLNPNDTVGTALKAIDFITGNTTNPSSINSSGQVTLNTGVTNDLAVNGDPEGVFGLLGFTSSPSATRTGGGTPGTGIVTGNDVSTFDNESISGGAITVFNSAGTPINIQLRWALTDSATLGPGHQNTWNLFYQNDPNATGTSPAWTNVGQNFNFNVNGALTSPSGGVAITNTNVGGQQLGNLTINFASGSVTQFASTGGNATIGQITQNGFAAGQLQSVAINNSGLVVGTFSNGQNIDLASITLSHFNGTNYLKALDGGAYAVTDQSGPAIIGASGTIAGSSLEGSNTDIADEFTKLIVTQQAYSANTKVITTANDMVQSLLNVLR